MKTLAFVSLATSLLVASCGRMQASALEDSPVTSAVDIAGSDKQPIDDKTAIRLGLTLDVNGNGAPDYQESWVQLPYQVSQIVFFGDSLTDTGNMYRIYGTPPSPPNWNGRYSNGPVWADYLHEFLGLPEVLVDNYAYGGATTGHDNASIPGAPGLLDEVEFYQQRVGGGPVDPNALFVLWIGPNDFANATQLANTVNVAMINIREAITELAAVGARRLLVLNAPDLSKTPRVRDLGDSVLSQRARIASIAFNSNLAWTLGDLERQLTIDIVACDFFSFFEGIAARPERYGFTDAVHRCQVSEAAPACPNPDQHVFWDGLHPTTAAHRLIAMEAAKTLLSGGAPLPHPGATPVGGMVVLDGPAHGAFVNQTSITVTGVVLAPTEPPTRLDINGIQVVPQFNGTFSASIPFAPSRIDQPIVATLTTADGSTVIDRERVVVFHGPSVGCGEAIDDALFGDVTRAGLDDVEDLAIHTLVAGGVLDIRSYVLSQPPFGNFSGTVQYAITPTNAGYSWATLELEPQGNHVGVRLNLHDVFLDWHAEAWLSGIWNPPVSCDGRVSAGILSVLVDLQISPSSVPGEVHVSQIGNLSKQMFGFGHWMSCNLAAQLGLAVAQQFTNDLNINFEQLTSDAIDLALGAASSSQVVPAVVQQAIGRVSLSRPLGSALGVPVAGNVTTIQTGEQLVSVGGYVAIGSSATSQRTVAVPHVRPIRTPLDPLTGQSYDFAVSVSLSTLNQLLAAKGAMLLPPQVIREMDLGSGMQQLTAGSLAALVPALQLLAPDFELELRITPTLPPMLLGGTAMTPGLVSDLKITQLMVAIAPADPFASPAPFLQVSLDLDAQLLLGFDTLDHSLTVRVANGVAHALVLDNPFGVEEQALTLILETLAPTLVANMGEALFALPDLAGVTIEPTVIVPESGYASLFFRASTPVGRPDLVIQGIQAPAQIDRAFGFMARVAVKNQGSGSTYGNSFMMRAFMSVDGTLGPEDPEVHSGSYSPSMMVPGDVVYMDLWMNAVPGLAIANQTLFVVVDGSYSIGSGGSVTERRERNNVGSVQVMTTDPDAYVAWVETPIGAVGGIGPRVYRVGVGRSAIGHTDLWVPLSIVIQNSIVPPLFGGVWLSPGQETIVEFSLSTPPVPVIPGSFGQITNFVVEARTNLQVDSNPMNNAATSVLAVASPYFDLAVEVLGPQTAGTCQALSWQVTVRNVGNRRSDPSCFYTTLALNPGPGIYFGQPGPQPFQIAIDPLEPPGSPFGPSERVYTINNYNVCWLIPTYQWLKAEIGWNCVRDGVPNGNDFDQRQILIQ